MIGNVTMYNNMVTERVTAYSQNFLSAGYSTEDANRIAYQLLDSGLSRQQELVCYDNAYMAVGLIILFCIPLILLIRNKRNKSKEITEAAVS
jgi:DHA2 family multidrug resistance protein